LQSSRAGEGGGRANEDDRPEKPEGSVETLSVEEAAHRLKALRQVYDDGYLSRDLYESLKRRPRRMHLRVRRPKLAYDLIGGAVRES